MTLEHFVWITFLRNTLYTLKVLLDPNINIYFPNNETSTFLISVFAEIELHLYMLKNHEKFNLITEHVFGRLVDWVHSYHDDAAVFRYDVEVQFYNHLRHLRRVISSLKSGDDNPLDPS